MEKRRDDFLSSAAFSTKMKGKRSMKPAAALQEFDGVRVVRAARGRKDRHSKVCTARGTKDRRVRLSPNTAILFYDVQDRLGYDRPSKAIDWLMKEAKSAIDALDKPPLPTPATNYNHSSAAESTTMLKFECGDDEFNPAVSGFGLFNEEAAPPLSSEQFMYTPTPLELFDTNSEMFRLQRILYANAGGEDYSSVSSANFFTEREPLQSSYSRIHNNSSQFQGFSFSDGELPDFCGAAIFNEEETMDNSKSSSTASFLHFEE